MKKIVLIFIVICVFFSCNHKRSAADYIVLGKSNDQYKSLNEYYEKRNSSVGNDFWIKFMFLNNPYNLDEKNIISIYVNSKLVYRGIYKQKVDLKGNINDLFFKYKNLVIEMEILTDSSKNVIWEHRFGSKNVFSWKEEYKIIYCGFLPTNEDVEKVCFIPHIEIIL